MHHTVLQLHTKLHPYTSLGPYCTSVCLQFYKKKIWFIQNLLEKSHGILYWMPSYWGLVLGKAHIVIWCHIPYGGTIWCDSVLEMSILWPFPSVLPGGYDVFLFYVQAGNPSFGSGGPNLPGSAHLYSVQRALPWAWGLKLVNSIDHCKCDIIADSSLNSWSWYIK